MRRDSILWALPHGIVEGIRDRRLLVRLGAATHVPSRARLARAARVDLLPPGGLQLLHTVVDVGANEGQWASAVLTLARPRRLVAVEPSPEMLPRLQARLGGRAGVIIHSVALGRSTGRARLNLTEHSHNASLARPRTKEMDALYGGGYRVTGEVDVDVRTLDDVTEDLDEISLLKIDVQGFEADVLAGGRTALARTRWILIETNFLSHYEGDALFPELHAALTAAGFALSGLSPLRVERGVGLWCDALYRNRSLPDGGD